MWESKAINSFVLMCVCDKQNYTFRDDINKSSTEYCVDH